MDEETAHLQFVTAAIITLISRTIRRHPTAANGEMRKALWNARPQFVVSQKVAADLWSQEVDRAMKSRVREVPVHDPAMLPQDAAVNDKQRDTVLRYMLDVGWVTLDSAAEDTGILRGSVSSRLRDLRMDRYGGFEVERRRVKSGDGSPRLYEYRLTAKLGHEESGQARLF